MATRFKGNEANIRITDKQINGLNAMPDCLKCGKTYEPVRKKQRFCCPGCRIAYNNDKKVGGIHLAPRVLRQLQGIADGQGVPIDEMASVMLARILNPDGRPLDDDEIYGEKQ